MIQIDFNNIEGSIPLLLGHSSYLIFQRGKNDE